MLRGAFKVAILAIVVYKVVELALNYGIHLHYKKHHPGECRQVKGLDFSSEDLEVTQDGLAFITSGVFVSSVPPGFADFIKSNNIKGNIFLYDFKQPDLGARKLKLKHGKDFNPETFHPHGISILEDKIKAEHLLYVVNHPDNAGDSVEKFKYLPKTSELVHLKSFSSDKLHVTNDLAVTAEDKFYISNYNYFKNTVMSIVEQLLSPVGFGSLVYFNGTDFTFVDSSIHAPNGVTVSRDKRHLYLALSSSKTLSVYDVKKNATLAQVQSVAIHTMPDNLHLSQSGDVIYMGAHPIPHKLMSHFFNPKEHSPSSVLSFPLKNGKIVEEGITELFYDHGDLISGSSIAAVYNNQLLIGSVINKLVICDVKVKI